MFTLRIERPGRADIEYIALPCTRVRAELTENGDALVVPVVPGEPGLPPIRIEIGWKAYLMNANGSTLQTIQPRPRDERLRRVGGR